MDKDERKLKKIVQEIKIQYPEVELILDEDNALLVYGNDDILWEIYEKSLDYFTSIEFNAGKGEAHYLLIVP